LYQIRWTGTVNRSTDLDHLSLVVVNTSLLKENPRSSYS
jgi:hypothetical protein